MSDRKTNEYNIHNVPGTTPLVAMALIDMAVSRVCVERKRTDVRFWMGEV